MGSLNFALLYIARISGIIAASLFAAELLQRTGAFAKISFLVRPICRLSHLSPQSSTAVLSAFLSPSAAAAMLRDFYERKLIGRRELFIASLSRALPIILMESRYMLPVLIPILGTVGLMYYATWVGINAAVTFSVLLAGRLLLPKPCFEEMRIESRRPSFREAARESLREFRRPLIRILRIMIPMILASFILSDLGVFEILALKLSSLSSLLPFPPEGLVITTAYIASPIASYPLAASLLSQGLLSARDVILCLLSGYLLAFPLHIRQLLPHYLGIFGPRPGLELMGMSVGSRSIFVLAAIGILARFWR